MFDPAQILLFIVIITLTILLMVLGIQVFFILRDLRKTISKANKVLDNTGQITESVSAPISGLSSLLMGLKAGGVIARIIKKVSEDDSDRPASQRDEQTKDKREEKENGK
ncbi:MAG: hypothetical protein HYW63_00385 [Candidatus Levybacteria bacterium]|nr:hypothetical protein [Candidatus Levybacteria bacterium]